jgi:hypothetical protein
MTSALVLKNNMQKEEEYLELLSALVDIVEASKGTSAGEDDRVVHAEGLAVKCLSHACSLLYLLRGTNIPELRVGFFDPGSINVLGRAILETFLIFHYIFVDPKNQEDQTFRYLCWIHKDLVERQGFPARSPQGKEKLKLEEKTIEQIRNNIKDSPYFEVLSAKQKEKLLAGRDWRFKGWKNIALSAGLGEVYADAFYAYLCSYAHAGSLSILQMSQTESAYHQRSLVGATMGTSMICIAFMVRGYCAYFRKSNTALQANEKHRKIIQTWIEIGASNLYNVDINWEEGG